MQIFARGVLVYLGVLGQKKPAVSGISISTSSYPQLEQLKTKECKTVIGVLSAVTKANNAEMRVDRQRLFGLLRRWRQIDINITEPWYNYYLSKLMYVEIRDR